MRLRLFMVMLGVLLVCSAAAPRDWPLHGGDAGGTRHSAAMQISPANVARLGVAWEFDAFDVRGRTHRGMQATPIVVDDALYVTGPWSTVYALDARTGHLRWRYDPGVQGQWARKACCDVVNRGVAVADGVVFVATIDGYLDALDARAGKRLWRADTLIDRARAYSITGAPALAGNLVVIGNGGGELGVRGYVSAYDRDSGALVWRFWTVPGAGDDEDEAITAARRSWSPQSRFDFGLGGTAWDSMIYDPQTGLIFVGTGNGSPWPTWIRSPGGGDNLYLSSILAIRARDGKLAWHYQTTPGESWDYTATQNMILGEVPVGGRLRQVLMQAPKNGIFYVLDRKTGELLAANPYTQISWAHGVDLETGRPRLNEAARYVDAPALVRPGIAGGHNWQPMAFNASTGLAYIPVLQEEMAFLPWRDGWARDTISVEARVDLPRGHREEDPFLDPAEEAPHSVLVAFDPVTGKARWTGPSRPWWSGGVLSTASGLVFQGGSDGVLLVHDAKTGAILHRLATGTAIMAPPISYVIDDIQYVAVVAGLGGSVKVFPPGSAAIEYENRERLLVFRLGGGAVKLPPRLVREDPQSPSRPPELPLTTLAQGEVLYFRHCARCHNPRGAPNNYPDLWTSPVQSVEAFRAVLLNGTLEPAGMPRFDDFLSSSDVDAIHAYIRKDIYLWLRERKPNAQ